MKNNLVKNMFLVIYSKFFSILITGFDLGPYFTDRGLKNNKNR